MQKGLAEGVRTDLIHWITIRRLRIYHFAIKSVPQETDPTARTSGSAGQRRGSPEQSSRGGAASEYAVSGPPGVK